MTDTVQFRGLTWSHPRGFAPMRALAELAGQEGPLALPHSSVHWDAQDLDGFESHPIDDLASRYDLLVLDHPGLGRAERAHALAPLDDLFTAEELGRWAATTVGRAFESYNYGGRQWAAPIDAAAQVAAYRPDLIDGVPPTWKEVLALPAEMVVCVPTAGPHTLLTFLGLAAAVEPNFTPSARHLVPREVALTALDLLRGLVGRTPAELLDLNPIEILDRMQTTDLACCPLVFGYVNYSRAGPNAVAAVRFTDAPALDVGGSPGSVLGGTGLAIARRSADNARLLDHVRQAMRDHAQRVVIPAVGGQPSAIAAWEDARVNADWLDFYQATRRTQEAAWRRPRFDGWIAVQSGGSRLLYLGLRRGRASNDLLEDLDAYYRAHRPGLAAD